MCWLSLLSINLLVKNNLGFCLFKWCGVRWILAVLGLASLPIFRESLQCDWDSEEQEPRSCADLYLVTSFICLGLSGKGRIPWVPDFLKFKSKSLSTLPDKDITRRSNFCWKSSLPECISKQSISFSDMPLIKNIKQRMKVCCPCSNEFPLILFIYLF